LPTSLHYHSFKKKILKVDCIEEVCEDTKKEGGRPNLEARRQEEEENKA
jgi:hypothetical protein